jgi:protoporphyrinogen oxidase
MSGVVQELYSDLNKLEDLEIKLNWTVNHVEILKDGRVSLVSSNGETLHGDSVIVTIPPKFWSNILELPPEKEIARNLVGER